MTNPSRMIEKVPFLYTSFAPPLPILPSTHQTGDELRAVYFYCRALAASDCPFPTARDNLLLLFEKSRAKFVQQLPIIKERLGAPPHPTPLSGGGRPQGGRGTSAVAGPRAAAAAAASPAALADMSVCFVRLFGALYDRINLEQLGEISAVAFAALDRALGGWVEAMQGFGGERVV